MDWSRNKYNEYYNHYMPWIEDKYLQWFGENKTSYTTKETLKTPLTSSTQINNAQSDAAETVGSTLGSGGVLQPVGDAVSKEGFNRAERGQPAAQEAGKSWGESVSNGAGQVGSGISGAVGGLGSGLMGGGGGGDAGGEKGEKKGGNKGKGEGKVQAK